MSDAQLMHAEKIKPEVRKLTRANLLEARQNRLQGRICPRDYFGAHHCVNVGSDVG